MENYYIGLYLICLKILFYNNFLNNPIYKKLKSDPTLKYQNKVKNIMKQSKLVVNNLNNRLINPNPSAPKLRANTKIHKKDYQIRPVVNYKSAPAYLLKKQLTNILQEKLIIENQYNIKKFFCINKYSI